MHTLFMRRALAIGMTWWVAGCSPLNTGLMTPLMAPKPASYHATPGLMALTPYVVFRDQTGALSLQAETGRDVPWQKTSRKVTGRACQYGLQFPLGLFDAHRNAKTAIALSAGWGDGGAGAALEDASRGLTAGDVLYDIRVDLNTVTIFSVWREKCVIVNARVAQAALKDVAFNSSTLQHL